MSRKGQTPVREVIADPKHGSEMVARFINMVMKNGKKSIAEQIVYGAMDVIGEKNPNALVAIFNVNDAVEPSFATRAKMGQSSDVYAVALTADGKAYFAKKEVKVTLGGCGG